MSISTFVQNRSKKANDYEFFASIASARGKLGHQDPIQVVPSALSPAFVVSAASPPSSLSETGGRPLLTVMKGQLQANRHVSRCSLISS